MSTRRYFLGRCGVVSCGVDWANLGSGWCRREARFRVVRCCAGSAARVLHAGAAEFLRRRGRRQCGRRQARALRRRRAASPTQEDLRHQTARAAASHADRLLREARAPRHPAPWAPCDCRTTPAERHTVPWCDWRSDPECCYRVGIMWCPTDGKLNGSTRRHHHFLSPRPPHAAVLCCRQVEASK